MIKSARFLSLITLVFASAVNSRAQLFVANSVNGTIGEYKTDGTVISNQLVSVGSSSNYPYGLVASGSNLYTCNVNGKTIGLYNTNGIFFGDIIAGRAAYLGFAISGTDVYVGDESTGFIDKYTLVNGVPNLVASPFISTGGSPQGMVVVGTNLFVADVARNAVGLYSTSGLTINASLIPGLNVPYGLVVTGTNLYVANAGGNTIGWYSMSGAAIKPAMVAGLHIPIGLATDGTNLFVANLQDPGGDAIGSYTLSGATNNASLITGLHAPAGLAWLGPAAVTPVPLSAALSGHNVVLSWPASGAVFRLRQSTNVATQNWVAVTNVPVSVSNGAVNQVTLPATNISFFDLINP